MLNLENVNVTIGKKKIIKNASFEVKKGSIVGLIGPNGAGKTTIMKTILGLTKFSGNIFISDEQITEKKHSILTSVGALIEHPAIYPFMSGMQNLELYSQDDQDTKRIINELKMSDYINNKAKDFSLGMKQKLGIAIALLNSPNLVILDEPMNGLDVEATILVRNLITKYSNEGVSFLISSHILSELEKIITDVVIINNGQILLKKSIENFNDEKFSKYSLKVSDLKVALVLFKEDNIEFEKNGEKILINKKDIYVVEELLLKNKIFILDLHPKVLDFEQRIVQLLEKKDVK